MCSLIKRFKGDYKPVRLLIITIGGIFFAEIIAMIVVYLIRPSPFILETLIDAAIMVILIFPVIYYLSYRPLLLNINQRYKVEKALWESNEFLEQMFSLTHVLIAYLDKDFNFIRVNRTYARSDEHEPDFYIGKNHFELFPNPENEAIFREVIETGEPYSTYAKAFTYEAHPERQTSYWDWTLTPIKNDQGKVTALVLSLIDVTARVKAQLALAESELRFQAIFNQTYQFIALLKPGGEVLEINQTALDFVGLERNAILGQPMWVALAANIHPPMKQKMQQSIVEAAEGKLARYEGEMSGTQPDPSYFDFTLKPVSDREDRVTIIIAEGRDISNRKKMEKALERERQRLYALLDNLPAFVALQSPDYTIHFANQYYRSLFGDPSGKRCYEIMHGLTEPCPDCLIPEVISTQTPQTWEKTYPGGKYFQIYGYPFSDIDQSPVVLELGVDITENKAAEQKIQQNTDRVAALAETLRSILEVGPDYPAVLEKITRSAVQLIGDGCVVRLVSADRTTHRAVALHHADEQTLTALADSFFADTQLITTGIDGLVIQTGKPLFLPNRVAQNIEQIVGIDSPVDASYQHVNSLICVPLQTGDTLIGTLTLFRDRTEVSYTLADFQFVHSLADQAALAIHNARLFESELDARQTAEILRDASWALSQTLELDKVIELFLDYADRLAPSEWAQVFLIEDEEHLALRAQRGTGRIEAGAKIKYDLESEPGFRDMLVERNSLIISDCCQVPKTLKSNARPEGPCSWLGIPLVADEKAIGICIFENTEAGVYSEQHVHLLEALVGQVTVTIQNAWFFEQVRSGRERLQSLSRSLVEVQESERRYIARELHDEASQALASLLVGLRLIERDVNDPASVLAGAAELKIIAESVIDSLYRLAMDLRPASLDILGLVAAIRQHAEAMGARHNLVVQFEASEIDERLPPDTETAIYRIVQEALSNVVLHAQATRVDILLEKRADTLIVIVEDNGIGFDPVNAERSERMGLVGMLERAEMLGGKLTVESQTGIGTTLVLEAPYGH